ncbi:MAG: hypothetical protein JNJ88_01895 [Planctomycetes bacterium]|nr:hypothetical protein [Planctomycetota bacterium]
MGTAIGCLLLALAPQSGDAGHGLLLRIVDVDGRAIAGATAMEHFNPDRRGNAGTDGLVRLEGVWRGAASLLVEAPGFATKLFPHFDGARLDGAPLEVTLRKADPLEVQFVTENGLPAKGVCVSILAARGLGMMHREPWRTDAEGRIRWSGFDGDARRAKLEHAGAGVGGSIELGNLGGDRKVTVRNGVVIRPELVGEPQSQETVLTIEQIDVEVLTKSQDGWKIGHAGPGPEWLSKSAREVLAPIGDVYRIRARLSDGRLVSSGDVSRDVIPADGTVGVKIDPPQPISGQVIDRDGKGVASLPIAIEVAGAAAVEVRTDAEGRFEAKLPAPGEWTVRTIGGGLALEPPVDDAPGRRRPSTRPALPPNTWRAHSARAVEGKITFSGRAPERPLALQLLRLMPADSARRTLSVARGICDRAGSFRFEGLAPGSYVLSPQRPHEAGDAASAQTERIELLTQRNRFEVRDDAGPLVTVALDLPPREPRFVRGTVYAEGKPVAGAALRLLPMEREPIDPLRNDRTHLPDPAAVSAGTDAEGRFELPILRGGAFHLEATYRGAVETRRIELSEAQSRTVHFDVSDGFVKGTLSGEDGAPLPGIRVALQRARDAERAALFASVPEEVSTDAQGRFSFCVPGAGRFRLLAYDPMWRVASAVGETLELAPHARVELPRWTLEREAPLHVSAGDVDGGPGTGRIWVLSAAKDRLPAHLVQAWLFPSKLGIVIHGLPAGDWRVRLLPFEDMKITLATGAAAKLRFEKRRPKDEVVPASDSAYHAPDAEEAKRWDWGGEIPDLYAQEDLDPELKR